MSYLMTSSGIATKPEDYTGWAIIDSVDAQDYIRARIDSIMDRDGEHVYFIDDRLTGTSHEIVGDAEDRMNHGDDFESTLLGRIVSHLLSIDHCIRIWWADNSEDAHLRVAEASSLNEAGSIIQEQISRGRPISIRIKK